MFKTQGEKRKTIELPRAIDVQTGPSEE